MTSALAVYGAALRAAARGDRPAVHLVDVNGQPLRTEQVAVWCQPHRPGDAGLLDRCAGPTLDVGCGPGRLVGALTERGRIALGVDASAEAVRQARRRGAAALHRCVFSRVPAEGRWRHILLTDGNIGIGGDPVRLLRRCGALASRGGDVLVELDRPGAPTWTGQVALSDGTLTSGSFAWAGVGADGLAAVAATAAMTVLETWTEADRWFARLTAT